MRKFLPLVSFIVLIAFLPHAEARNTKRHASQALGDATLFAPTFSLPTSTPDNWLGDTGNWSNPSYWSSGLPGQSSDVTINTGNDFVTLDTSATINSLTLGGSTGSSTLIDTNNGGYFINIAGALTVNQSGTLSLSFEDSLSAGSSNNAGTINLQAANLQVGNLGNTGVITFQSDGDALGYLTANAVVNSGTINGAGYQNSIVSFAILNNSTSGWISSVNLSVSGAMTNAGGLNDSPFSVGGLLTNSGGIQVYWGGSAGSLNNSGLIDIIYNSLSVNNDALNSGQITIFAEDDPNGAGLGVDGTLTNSQTGNITVGGSGLSFLTSQLYASKLVNSGNIQLQGDAQLFVNSTVTNSGVFSTTNPGGDQTNSISIGGRFTNNSGGVFQLLGANDTATIANLVNYGQISVGNGAVLTVPVTAHNSGRAFSGFFNAGNVLIQQGSEISSFAGYTQTLGQTTVDGHLAGIINFGGGSMYGDGGTISGSITSNASINFGDAPLTVGQMTFGGTFTQGIRGNLTFDIASATQYDQMNITGQARLNGTMTVDLLHGYIPQIGNAFQVMTFASESGTFSNVVGLPIDNQEHFVLDYNSNDLTLDVVAGQMDGVTSVKLGSGNSIGFEPYIQTAEAGSDAQVPINNEAPSQTTPEPTSVLLLGSGCVGLYFRFMHRRQG